jgi:folate-dependent phosphoribosylglycinamide formyltransferase PurN
VIVVSGDYAGNSGFQAFKTVARSTTLPYFIYKLFVVAIFKVLRSVSRRSWEVEDLARRLAIPLLQTPQVNSDDVEALLRRLQPDLVVSVSCPQRIRQSLLDVPRLGGINIHSSLLPVYAGLAPYFWVLANGESCTGTTIHYMTKRFDEGKVLLQEELTIPVATSAFALFVELAHLGRTMMPKAVDLACANERGSEQDASRTSYYSHPNWTSYLSLRRRGHRLIRLRDCMLLLRRGDAFDSAVGVTEASNTETRRAAAA